MKRKQPYLLLELLIAFTILSFSILLLIQSPLLFLQDEIRALENIELQRIADVKFAEIKAKLEQAELKPEKKSSLSSFHEPITLKFEGVGERSFKTSYELSRLASKKGHQGEKTHRLGVNIVFTPVKGAKKECVFDYETCVTIKPRGINAG